MENIDLIKLLCKLMDEKLNRDLGTSEKLISLSKIVRGMTLDMQLMLQKLKMN